MGAITDWEEWVGVSWRGGKEEQEEGQEEKLWLERKIKKTMKGKKFKK